MTQLKHLLLGAILSGLWFVPAWAAGKDIEEVSARLKRQYPKYSFDRVERTEVPGIYLVYGTKNLLYFVPESGHLIAGDIWNPHGENISEYPRRQFAEKQRQARAAQMKEMLANLPLDKAVRIGNGPKKVIEITDPDCPFCRKGAEFFEGRDDVTRYVFFFPLEQIHPQARAKASYILSSPDAAKAYHEVVKGKYDTALPQFSDNGRLAEHLEVARQLGVKGTPNYWVVEGGESVSGADFAKLSQLLR